MLSSSCAAADVFYKVLLLLLPSVQQKAAIAGVARGGLKT